eukprot:766271-Hanusia_phi.AAC.4
MAALRDNDVPINDDSRRFALQLMKSVPKVVDNRAAEKAAKLKQQEKERQRKQVEMLQKNNEYTLLNDDADDIQVDSKPSDNLKKLESKELKREKKEKKRNLRKTKWNDDDDDDDKKDEPSSKKPKATSHIEDEEEALEEWELEELARLRDLAERDEFVNRLKVRDEKKTKKLVAEKDEVLIKDDETGEHRTMTEEERNFIFEESRIVSRQAYLEKRENKKIGRVGSLR